MDGWMDGWMMMMMMMIMPMICDNGHECESRRADGWIQL